MEPIQSPFEGFTEVADQMPPVKDVLGLGCAWGGATRILRRAVTTADEDARMCPEPCGEGISRAIGPQVNRPMVLQIHQQGAVRTPTPQCPSVHPEEGGCRHRWGGRYCRRTQQGIRARWPMEPGSPAVPRFATKRKTDGCKAMVGHGTPRAGRTNCR
jgi:hypothetical protein